MASITYYVVPNGAGSKNGLSWDNAHALPSNSITAANAVAPTSTDAGLGHTIYVAPGTYADGLTLTNANIAGVTIIGTSAAGATSAATKGQVILTNATGGVVANKNNITIKNLSFTGATTTNNGIYNNGGTGLALDNVYVYDNANSNLNIIGAATFTVTNSKFSGLTGNYNVTIGGSAAGSINYCIIERSAVNKGGLFAAMLNGGSGVVNVQNCVISGSRDDVVMNSSTGTLNLTNCYVSAGTGGAYTLKRTNGTFVATTNYLEYSSSVGHELLTGTITDASNIKGTGFKAKALGKAPLAILIPSIADNANLTSMQALAAALPSGKKGTVFLIGNSTAEQAGIQAILDGGKLIAESHSYSHSDMNIADDTTVFTLSGAVTVDRAADTITSAGGTVTAFKSKTLAQIKTALEGAPHSLTVTPLAGYNTTTIMATSLGEILKNGAGTTTLKLLVDATAATGYYKVEMKDSMTAIASRFGYTPRVFATPMATTNANVEAAAKAAGYIGLRAGTSTTTTLQSVQAYQIYLYGAATQLHNADIAETRKNIHALLSIMSIHGGIFNIGADALTDFTQGEWQALFDACAEYPNIQIMDMGSALAYIRGTPAQWTTADDITYTVDATWWATNWGADTGWRLSAGSPAINAGVPIAGLTIDYAGNTVRNPPSIGAYEYTASASPRRSNFVAQYNFFYRRK